MGQDEYSITERQGSMANVPAGARQRVTWLSYLLVLLAGLHNGWIGSFLPAIAREQSLPLAGMGIVVSANFAGFLLAVLASSAIVGRWGGRTALIVAGTLMGVGLLVLGLLPGLPALLFSALLLGLGIGVLDVAANVAIATFNPDRVTAALNYLNVSFGVGALAGPLLAGLVLAKEWSYGVAFGSVAAGAALAAALLVLTPLPHQRGTLAPSASGTDLFSRPALWLLGGALLCYVGVETALGAWLFTFLRQEGGLTVGQASWQVSLLWAGLLAGRLLGGRLAEWIATERLTLGATTLAVAALTALTFGFAPPAFSPLTIVLIGVGLGPVFPNVIATGVALFPARVSAATATLIALSALGGLAGPWLVGRTLGLWGTQPAFVAICGAAAFILVLYAGAGYRSAPAARLGRPQP